MQQEPLIDGNGSLLHQSVSAWLRVIGRLRPGASIAGMAPRLTGVLRQWMQYDSGYPANWMPDVIRMLPKQVINVVPAGAGVARRLTRRLHFFRHSIALYPVLDSQGGIRGRRPSLQP